MARMRKKVAGLAAAAAFTLASGAFAREASAMALWGYSEFQMPGPEVFPRYVEMIRRYSDQYRGLTSACTTAPTAFCTYIGEWAELIREAEARRGIEQIERVNSYFNRFRYIPDEVNWRTVDYWATPLQFYDVNGDCEDYAISKYYDPPGAGLRALTDADRAGDGREPWVSTTRSSPSMSATTS